MFGAPEDELDVSVIGSEVPEDDDLLQHARCTTQHKTTTCPAPPQTHATRNRSGCALNGF